jgi:hypothetical protein
MGAEVRSVWKSLFSLKAILRKSCDWLWRQFNPVAVSGLEFWEVRNFLHPSRNISWSANIQQFKLNPVPKLVDPVKKDKLPYDEDSSPRDTQRSDVNKRLASDWEFSPLIGEELITSKG